MTQHQQSSIRRVCVIVNPTSGKDERPIIQPLHRVLTELDIEYDLHILKQAGDCYRFALEAVEQKFDAVMVYGGDGTVREAATALRGTTVPLAILRGGTVNILAVELDIPAEVEAAARLLGEGEVRSIDMLHIEQPENLEITDAYSVVRFSIGYLAEVVEAANTGLKDKLGKLAHTVTTLQTLNEYRPIRFNITIDGVHHEIEGATCLIANTGNIGTRGVKVDQEIRVDDGLLDVVILPATIGGLPALVASLLGREESLPHWQGRSVTVAAETVTAIERDGDDFGKTPISVSVDPSALRVVCPLQVAAGESERS